MGRGFAFLLVSLVAIAPHGWCAGPIVYLGTSSQAVEFSVANSGHFFAELSAGQMHDVESSYAAFRIGARTTGKNVFEVSIGEASVAECSRRLGETFVPSIGFGTGFSEGRLRAMFNFRYLEGHGSSCVSPTSGEVIALAGVGYQF